MGKLMQHTWEDDTPIEEQAKRSSKGAVKRTKVISVIVTEQEKEMIDKRIQSLFRNAIGRSAYLRYMGLKGKL